MAPYPKSPEQEESSASIAMLVVEDDAPLAELFVRLGHGKGYRADAVATVAEARAALEARAYHLLVTDVRLPDGSGLDLLPFTRAQDPRIAIVVVTAFGSIELAVRAVREGAWDFLTKPVEPTLFSVAIDRAIEARRMRAEIERLRGELAAAPALAGIVGKSAALADMLALVRRVADTHATVLVTGPSGSGKELVARALHDASLRKNGPFVAVNAAAIPEALLESELFGYVKGAFTDARADRRGLLSEADGGTLFLDEIGDLSLPLQAKLLRVLEEREVRPLGSNKSVPLDVRFVAATNANLRHAVQEGRFRADLFYRLAVIEVTIPALKDRPEDILPLAEHFLARAASRAGRPLRGFSGAAARRLMAHSWPGNVRELENAVERATILADLPLIRVVDLPPIVQRKAPADDGREEKQSAELASPVGPASPPSIPATSAAGTIAPRPGTPLPLGVVSLKKFSRDQEAAYINHVLALSNQNKEEAAKLLDISLATLYRKLAGEAE
jgi:DNA-binding NtrC family response regulator